MDIVKTFAKVRRQLYSNPPHLDDGPAGHPAAAGLLQLKLGGPHQPRLDVPVPVAEKLIRAAHEPGVTGALYLMPSLKVRSLVPAITVSPCLENLEIPLLSLITAASPCVCSCPHQTGGSLASPQSVTK